MKVKIFLSIIIILLFIGFLVFLPFILSKKQFQTDYTSFKNNTTDNQSTLKEDNLNQSSQNQSIQSQQAEPKKIVVSNNSQGTILELNPYKEPYFMIVVDKSGKAHTLEIDKNTFIKTKSSQGYGPDFLSNLKKGDVVTFESKGEPGKTFLASLITLKESAKVIELKEIYSYEGIVKSLAQDYLILQVKDKNIDIKVNFDSKTKFIGPKPQVGSAVIVSNPDINLKGKTEIYAKYIQTL